MKNELKTKIYLTLKQKNEQQLDEIHANLAPNTFTKKEIAACLDQLIKDGWVIRYGRAYKLKYVLDRPFRKEEVPKNRDWVYEHIQEVQLKGVEAATTRPVTYMNPWIDWIPQCDQGGRGTCCGHSGMYVAWLLQLKLIEEHPPKEDVQKVEYNKVENIWDKCSMIRDIKHYSSPSAGGIYVESRKADNVTYPSGSTIRGVAKALTNHGYNYEKDWYTSKTDSCVPLYYPLHLDKEGKDTSEQFLADQGALHKLDGYAQVLTWDGLKDAIWNYGCCLIAINVYENMENNGKTGPFPDPRGDVIGGHALCAIGYDEKFVYFLHSWRDGWSKVGGMSQNYYNQAAGPSYAPLDSADTIEGQKIYGQVIVKCNVPCTILIGADKYVGTDAKASIELGTEVDILATPVDPNAVVEPEMAQFATPTKEIPIVNIIFNFTLKPKTSWITDFIKKLFKSIFHIK